MSLNTWLIVFAEQEHNIVPTDVRAHVMAENSPGARLYPAMVVRTTKPVTGNKRLERRVLKKKGVSSFYASKWEEGKMLLWTNKRMVGT